MRPEDVSNALTQAQNQTQAKWRQDLGAVPLDLEVDKGDYRKQLAQLQDELSIQHNALMANKRRCILVFEGWDAAGKGGAVKRLTADWDPRGYTVWPIAAPDAHERARHYLYRFWKRLPAAGSVAIFDRSWYGRVMVERVEGYCSDAAWQRAYDEINAFEKTLVENGSAVLKFFLQVSPDEQAKRFKRRMEEPHKRWKITREDFRNRDKRVAYEEAITDMLGRTHTPEGQWIVIPGEDKRFARLAVLGAVLAWMKSFDMELSMPLDPALEEMAAQLD